MFWEWTFFFFCCVFISSCTRWARFIFRQRRQSCSGSRRLLNAGNVITKGVFFSIFLAFKVSLSGPAFWLWCNFCSLEERYAVMLYFYLIRMAFNLSERAVSQASNCSKNTRHMLSVSSPLCPIWWPLESCTLQLRRRMVKCCRSDGQTCSRLWKDSVHDYKQQMSFFFIVLLSS